MSEPATPIQRSTSAALDAILGEKIPTHGGGVIRVVDYMGDDRAIVQAARVSYGEGTKTVNDDRGLIRYLMRHGHTSPFEMVEIKLHVRAPIHVARQWLRHRTASVNERSLRYTEYTEEFETTDPSEWRTQAKDNKQGSGGALTGAVTEQLSLQERLSHQQARSVYEDRLVFGVAREQARKDLPLSTFTEWYWKIDLHNLLHFLKLRMADDAQLEIRRYADAIGEVVEKWCPLTWEAFVDFRLEAISLSQLERVMLVTIQDVILKGNRGWWPIGNEIGWLDIEGNPTPRSSERDEFEAKAARLGIKVPWRE